MGYTGRSESIAQPQVHVLDLPSGPGAVRTARHWVCRMLHLAGRDDLADSAALAVSELVTNALIHGLPPVAVRMHTRADGAEPPRIEVLDGSLAAPRPTELVVDEDEQQLSTVGRGLALVGHHSVAWGAEPMAGGKIVWFEPRAEPDEEVGAAPFDLTEGEPERDTLTLRLTGMPLRIFTTARAHYLDLRREVQLLGMTQPQNAVIGEFASAMSEIDRTRSHGEIADAVRRGAASGAEVISVEWEVPASAPARMGQLRRLLVEASQELEQAGLLSSPPRGDERMLLLLWYLGEFERQADGQPPLPAPALSEPAPQRT